MGKRFDSMTNGEKVDQLQGAALDVLVDAFHGEISEKERDYRIDYLADLLYDVDRHANII